MRTQLPHTHTNTTQLLKSFVSAQENIPQLPQERRKEGCLLAYCVHAVGESNLSFDENLEVQRGRGYSWHLRVPALCDFTTATVNQQRNPEVSLRNRLCPSSLWDSSVHIYFFFLLSVSLTHTHSTQMLVITGVSCFWMSAFIRPGARHKGPWRNVQWLVSTVG